MKLQVKKPKTKKVLTPKQKIARTQYVLNWIVGKYNTGDLDLTKPSHYIAANVAVGRGLIPREVFEDDK